MLALPRRTVAIGDLHGDWKATVMALQAANVVDSNLDWTGGDTLLVQMGDITDRKRHRRVVQDEASEIRILRLLHDLGNQAAKVGGRVEFLLGNHEIMNAMGAINYASPANLQYVLVCSLHERRLRSASLLCSLAGTLAALGSASRRSGLVAGSCTGWRTAATWHCRPATGSLCTAA